MPAEEEGGLKSKTPLVLSLTLECLSVNKKGNIVKLSILAKKILISFY